MAWTRAAWRKKHGAGPWTWSFGGSGEGVLVGTYGLILPASFRGSKSKSNWQAMWNARVAQPFSIDAASRQVEVQ